MAVPAAVIMLDTDVLIDVFRGYTPRIQLAEELSKNHTLLISAITEME